MPSSSSQLLASGITLCAFLALAATAQAQELHATGVVQDGRGAPVAGALVLLQSTPAGDVRSATTDGKGHFNLPGLQAGTWVFTISAEGYRAVRRHTFVEAGNTADAQHFDLQTDDSTASPPGARELQLELEAADALYEARHLDRAIATYEAILRREPSLVLINLQIGKAFRQMKEPERALEAFQRVLAADPGNERAKVAIGSTHLERGDLRAAERTLAAAAECAGAGADVFYNLGEVKLAQGYPDEAVAWFKRAADLDQSWFRPLFKLGLSALGKGDKETAARLLEQVIALEASTPEAEQARSILDQIKKRCPAA
jgi:tetratricopeptide (TPR) repeat protein